MRIDGQQRPPPEQIPYYASVEVAMQPSSFPGLYLKAVTPTLYKAEVMAIRVTAGTATSFALATSEGPMVSQVTPGQFYGFQRKPSDYGYAEYHGAAAPVSNLSVPAEQAVDTFVDLSDNPIVLNYPGALLIYSLSINDELVVDLWWRESLYTFARTALPALAITPT